MMVMKTLDSVQSAEVLLIVDGRSLLADLINELLIDQQLAVKTVILDEKRPETLQHAVDSQAGFYKTILLLGQPSLWRAKSQTTSLIGKFLNDHESQLGHLSFILSVSSALDLIDQICESYDEQLRQQQLLLELILRDFPESAVFLAQDMMFAGDTPTYPPLLILANLSQGKLLDFDASLNLQDELSFFQLIKGYLLKPHDRHRFLISGRRINVGEVVVKIKSLYQRYFQKELLVAPLSVSPAQPAVWQQFSRVVNSKTNLEELIDGLVRQLPKLLGEGKIPAAHTRTGVLVVPERKVVVGGGKTHLTAASKPPKTAVVNSYQQLLRLLSFTKKPPVASSLVSPPSTELLDGELEEIFVSNRVEEKIDRRDKNVKEVGKIVRKSRKRRVLFATGAFLMTGALLLVAALGFYRLSTQQLDQQLFILLKQSTRTEAPGEQDDFWKATVQRQLDLYEGVLSEEELLAAMEKIHAYDSLTMLLLQRQELAAQLFLLYQDLFAGGVDLNPRFSELSSVLEKRLQLERELNVFFTSLNMDLFSGQELEVWGAAVEQNSAALRQLAFDKQLLEAWGEQLLEHKYFNLLIVLQDSQHLRGTGGLLGEMLLLSFSDRGLVDLRRFDVSDLQRLSYGKQSPSEDVVRLFGADTEQLLYKNYDSDLPLFAQQLAPVVQETLGLRADAMLFVSGGGDDGVHRALASVERLSQKEFVELLSSLERGLVEKEFFLHSSHVKLQQLFELGSWSGKPIAHQCPSDFAQENCLIDFIVQVQNDLQPSQGELVLQQEIKHGIGVGKELVRHRRQITISNQGGGVTHRISLSFLLPHNATIDRLELDGQRLSVADGDWELLERERGREVLLKISVGDENRQLLLSYAVPNSFSSNFAYTFLEQKQAGWQDKKLTYDVVFDEALRPQLIAPRARYENKIIRFERDNRDHFVFAVGF